MLCDSNLARNLLARILRQLLRASGLRRLRVSEVELHSRVDGELLQSYAKAHVPYSCLRAPNLEQARKRIGAIALAKASQRI